MLKTASGGYFLIPAGPADGTSISSSSSANTYGSWTQMVAATSAPIFIVAIAVHGHINVDAYVQIDIGTGAAASESSIGEWKFNNDFASGGAEGMFATLPFPIPVPTATRIACRVADEDAAAQASIVTLICINQSDLVSI